MPLLSLVEKKLFSLQKVFSHTYRIITVALQHLAEGEGGSMRHGFARDGAVTLGMAMGWSWDLKHSQV